MIEAVRTSETSVYFSETTRPFIPEGCRLYDRRHENLKSQETASDLTSEKYAHKCLRRARYLNKSAHNIKTENSC
jgi:hypothetical protein